MITWLNRYGKGLDYLLELKKQGVGVDLKAPEYVPDEGDIFWAAWCDLSSTRHNVAAGFSVLPLPIQHSEMLAWLLIRDVSNPDLRLEICNVVSRLDSLYFKQESESRGDTKRNS